MVQGGLLMAIREALMVVAELPEINRPSGRVLGHVLLAISTSGLWRQNIGENHVTEDLLRQNIGRRGHQGRSHPTRRVPGVASPLVVPLSRLRGGGPPLDTLRASGV